MAAPRRTSPFRSNRRPREAISFVGDSYSYGSGGDPTIWIIKLNASGDLQWQKEYLHG